MGPSRLLTCKLSSVNLSYSGGIKLESSFLDNLKKVRSERFASVGETNPEKPFVEKSKMKQVWKGYGS